ncbi:hypothetical protein Tco_0786974 [Tanacetum coccineum]
MSVSIPPIPPPLGAYTGNTSSPNRVDTISTENTNNTTTNNVAQNVVDENLHQLLDSKGGFHVTNVLEFDKEDFTCWKVRFLVYLDGLEFYLLEILEDGPFVPLSSLSTSHEGPFDIRDSKIIALRLKFNAFKALKGKKYNYEEGPIDQIYELETNRFTIQASSSKALISNSQMKDSDSDVEEDLRRNSEFFADLNTEYHERALLANQKRFYKRSGRVGSARKPDEESMSSDDEGLTKIKEFMDIAEDELYVGKADARKHVLDYTHAYLHYVEDQRKNLLNKFNSLNQELSLLPGNIVRALGRRGKKKDTISSKEEPLPPLPKLSKAEPNDTSKDDISLADLTLNPTVSKEIKKVHDKRSTIKILKKKAKPVTSSVPDLSLVKKADSSTKKLLLTLMEEVKGLKEQIKIPSDTSLYVSQSESTKSTKGKQFGPCKLVGLEITSLRTVT